jgi:hypothetical protein
MEGFASRIFSLKPGPSIAMYYYDWFIDSAHGAFGYQIFGSNLTQCEYPSGVLRVCACDGHVT